MKSTVNPDPRRSLPAVDRLRREVTAAHPSLPEWALLEASRGVVEAARHEVEAKLATNAAPEALGALEEELKARDWIGAAVARARRLHAPHPRRVLNATGVVLHTNLGRAPLAEGAVQAAADAARGYSDLELDLETGRRGQRLASLAEKLRVLSGAEAAMACNNTAAAVLLALDTLARGREVIVSRGELVEIGGSFRVPAILEKAGVRLVEVGTTNRTHPKDYEDAIGPHTGLLLKVHRSNFEQTGFVKEVSLGALSAIGRAHGVPVVEDLGSGTLVDLGERVPGIPKEAFVPARLALGPDLVCFSGDKLLGGPQAGLIVGRAAVVDAMRSNPMARALRLDKMTLAALDWTLAAFLEGRRDEIPVIRQLSTSIETLERRAKALAETLPVEGTALTLSVELDTAVVGGGSIPGFELETCALVFRGPSVRQTQTALREGATPVVARLRDDALSVDLRTIDESELPALREALIRVLANA